MKTELQTINVVKPKSDDYTGFVLVKRIQRKATPIRETEKRGTPGVFRGRYRVSYKGKTYRTFNLPDVYGECAGRCIDIKYGE